VAMKYLLTAGKYLYRSPVRILQGLQMADIIPLFKKKELPQIHIQFGADLKVLYKDEDVALIRLELNINGEKVVNYNVVKS
jgi:hypothetical protein